MIDANKALEFTSLDAPKLNADVGLRDMIKYIRMTLLVILGAMHLTWITTTGSHYMNDVVTLGRQYYPVALPYGLLAATLSFLFGANKFEKAIALALFVLIAIALLQGVNIKVDGDRSDLIRGIQRQFEPKHSLAPWILIGFFFQQTIISIWRRKKYFSSWAFPSIGFALGYMAIGYLFIITQIHPSFRLSSTLPDAILVLFIGSIVFGILSILIMKFYGMSVTTFFLDRNTNPTRSSLS